ncbi:putative ankyrin repeats [Lyophyllum shimeji]|uniref:Ankyrin repeats n=1 Tax=Lyophyllum shimeji TaxID=47721 RepID=A0A9P3UR62_LYOSH|nr:putative ankyrin repeats [Lyophyllum shimeji]
MQSGQRAPGSTQAPVKIYNAVYSSVQVYECMVRGIAVMRRRNDSYVNATQILKVAGVDKGRRTKILEKEILPGKHEIVQGGYGKYQGTWIPLEKGRDIAAQYGVAPLLAPLFDFTPSTNSLAALPTGNYLSSSMPSALAPPPIMPGSALRLLNQGRAQGFASPSFNGGGYGQTISSQTPPPGSSLKRNRSEADADSTGNRSSAHFTSSFYSSSQPLPLDSAADTQMGDRSRPPSAGPHANGEEGPSPAKRLRKDSSPQPSSQISWQLQRSQTLSSIRDARSTPQPGANGVTRPPSSLSAVDAPASASPELDVHVTRLATKPSAPRLVDPSAPLRDNRRAAVIAAICQRDDPGPVLDLLREITPAPLANQNLTSSTVVDVDIILDDQGHTALHIAASLARQRIVQMLIANGADIHRGNYLGETPLMRACLATTNADQQTFHTSVSILHPSIRTLDTSRKSVLHHIVSLAGVSGRAVSARYYLEQIFLWIAHHQGGDFKSLVDLQDEHGDTALNIAARVGNRSLVRTLLDVGANRILPNKLGLRPGDFGVETEELSGGPRAEDILASLRTGPPVPVQKSQDVIADMTAMIQGLSTDFQSEVKAKQDALDVTQAHLRAATRELSEQRKQLAAWQARCAELDQINQRARNVEKAILDEDQFDWTGRTNLDGKDAGDTAGPAFRFRGASSTMVGIGCSVDISFNVDAEPPIPTGDSVANLIRLRRLKMWHLRMEELMQARLKTLQGASAEKEYQCKKIVALCTGIPIDKVEDMLGNLVIAVESEAQGVDIGRVSGFMQKVRDGVI